ncbi:hypothetical protein [Falsiroseomonas ponticola]|jgi:hypothetical protein|uniref:hypothetical protein n=1 Tax=Falsiroseomonas ponticola TaxID=2786951 RepID=UPI0019320C74|nr:hypothetical protein [Roseomonas ponticola]
MTTMLLDAAETLEALLRQETAALKARDLRAAAALQPAKTVAVEEFVKARASLDTGAALDHRLALLVDGLRDTAAANRAALEDALALQARVVKAIARVATRPEGNGLPGYARPARPGTGAVAFSVRA